MSHEESGGEGVPTSGEMEIPPVAEAQTGGEVVPAPEWKVFDGAGNEIVVTETANALTETGAPSSDENILEGEFTDVSSTPLESNADGSALFETPQSQTDVSDGPSYVTEGYREFGPLERKRSLYKSLLKSILAAIFGLNEVEAGPVIASYTRSYPIEFTNYLTGALQGGKNIPPFEEVIAQFPQVFDSNEETHEEGEFAEEPGNLLELEQTQEVVPEILPAPLLSPELPQPPEVPALTYNPGEQIP